MTTQSFRRGVLVIAGCAAITAAGAILIAAPADERSFNGKYTFDMYCAPCHGRDGKGPGAVASALNAVPPDLTILTARHGGTYPGDRVERYVTDGTGALSPAHESRTMPRWGPTFRSVGPAADATARIANVVAYIETLQTEIMIVSGPLAHHAMTNDLFRIGDVWIRVAPDTEFHRWLSSGDGARTVVTLTTDPSRFGDRRNVRIFTGTLNHSEVAREAPVLHVLFLLDTATGRLGPATLQTRNPAIAAKFDAHDNATISLIIAIKQ